MPAWLLPYRRPHHERLYFPARSHRSCPCAVGLFLMKNFCQVGSPQPSTHATCSNGFTTAKRSMLIDSRQSERHFPPRTLKSPTATCIPGSTKGFVKLPDMTSQVVGWRTEVYSDRHQQETESASIRGGERTGKMKIRSYIIFITQFTQLFPVGPRTLCIPESWQWGRVPGS